MGIAVASATFIVALSHTTVLLLESVLGTVWGWLGTSEGPNVPTVLGGLIVLTAVAIKLREGNAHPEREPVELVTVP